MRTGPYRSPASAMLKRPAVVLATIVVVILTTLGWTASAGATGITGAAPVNGGTVTYALPPGDLANYIFPLLPIADATPSNVQWMQTLIFRPLYSFGAGGTDKVNGNAAALNRSLSLAGVPVYSNGNKTVTITLKHYMWSDGTPVTARDVQFWQNLVTANKSNWFSYVPHAYPDNVVKTTILGKYKIQFDLDKAYSPLWFTYNELAQITPLPHQAWDKTSATSPVGNYDMSPGGAKKVYTYLAGQAKNERTYTTNPLWKVVDGPWNLTSFNGTTGLSTYTYNAKYSGPVAAKHIDKFIEEPFTTDSAEYNALRSGRLDYGYIPYANAAEHKQLSDFTFAPWVEMVIHFINANQNNPQVGPIFKQAYIREAMEELIDQKGIINGFYGGYGTQTCGPIPSPPITPWATSYEKSCPYGYNPAGAVKLLKAHGWNVVPNGVTTCAQPSKCGAGISKDTKLEFTFNYSAGNSAFENSVSTIKSGAAQAGIRYDLKGAPFATVVGIAAPCGPKSAAPSANCDWQIADFGGWGYEPDFYPTGELLFATGAGANSSNYSNPLADKYIRATQVAADSTSAMNTYVKYMVDQVPFIWNLNQNAQLSEVRTDLHGALPQSGEANIWPEEWSLTK